MIQRAPRLSGWPEFRTDVESFVSREVVEACVSPGCFERAPVSGISYFGFVDPSGGSSDAMTLAIGHRDGERAVLDAIRERKPPFSPDDVVIEFAALLKCATAFIASLATATPASGRVSDFERIGLAMSRPTNPSRTFTATCCRC